jgi:nicotinamidase-related amidase
LGNAARSAAGSAKFSHFEVDPRSTALIVIDMQKAFVAEGATYETPPARTMLPNLERIINFAREQGMPIVWPQSDHSAPFGGVMLKKFPTIREDKYLWKGQPLRLARMGSEDAAGRHNNTAD